MELAIEQDSRDEHTHADIVRANARYLANSVGSATRFAEMVDLADSYVSQMIGINPTKNIGAATARKMEAAFGKPKGWLDIHHPECTGEMSEESTKSKMEALQDRMVKAAACLRASLTAADADKQELVKVALNLLSETEN